MSAASCARSSKDPNEWFPDSASATDARREAAEAIAVCDSCLARACCLELSLRHWDIGQYGVWGGLVPAEREALRRKRRAQAGYDADTQDRNGSRTWKPIRW
jgi:Transcription factor WhiB